MTSYAQFDRMWGERALLAWDTLSFKPVRGIPSFFLHVMDIPFMEQATGFPPGDYARDPDAVYLGFQRYAGTCFLDQYIPENPLTMGQEGYSGSAARGATTGAERIVIDGMEIASPEDVVEHMEQSVFPRRAEAIASFGRRRSERIARMLDDECATQKRLGPGILKGPYGGAFQSFPYLDYTTYGYASYFAAYALYPDVMERDFAQQADLAVLANRDVAHAIMQGALPPQIRLDHDMADSRGTLVSLRSLEKLWLPHFARAVRPLVDAGITLVWHCDGNLMEMVPLLLEAGVGGFQGFQCEHGMDYAVICRMKQRDGRPLLIMAGVSVTRTLPFGTPHDVADELNWLVENGPPVGLFLGATSSVTPNTSRGNILALIEGLAHYRERGRG